MKKKPPRAGRRPAAGPPPSSPVAKALGAAAGLAVSLALLLAAVVWAIGAGWLPAPAFLLDPPAGLEAFRAAPGDAARASAGAKARAFAIARREKVATTLALSSAEIFALLERASFPADAVRIDAAGLWISRVAPLAGMRCRHTVALSAGPGGTLAALSPAARFLGTLPLPALPAWAGGAFVDRPAREAVSGLERALGVPAASLAVTPGDGELTLRTL